MNYQPKYNNKEGILEYLKDLDGLNRLQKDRADAFRTRNERLSEYIILGRWAIDTCGNFGKLSGEDHGSVIPANVFRGCPKVMTYDEMFRLFGGKENRDEVSISWSFSSEIPPTYVKCSMCEQPWSIQDAHDCVSKSECEVVDANLFIGATLSKIKSIPQYIDVSPHYVTDDGVRHSHQSEGSTRVGKDYIIQDGDKIFVQVWTYMHNECQQLSIIQSSLRQMTEVVNNTMLTGYKMIMLKNQYYSGDHEPWYRLQFNTSSGDHEILFGWRKRVISISWEKSGKDLKHLFEKENLTKEPTLIHAWGYEKATEYLKKIIEAL